VESRAENSVWNFNIGIEPEDLYIVTSDDEIPDVFTEEELQGLIANAPEGFIKETLIELSNREKEKGNIRLLMTKGDQMWFGQTEIPKHILDKLEEMKSGKVIN
jgi:hypothetical protein